MVQFHQKLSTKIIGILLLFFFVATVAIGMTLFLSWQLEGAAAAINDAGSERMRSYRIGYLLQKIELGGDVEVLTGKIQAEIALFEKVLLGLEQGDPLRPLFLPREDEIYQAVAALRNQWSEDIRPLTLTLLKRPPLAQRQLLLGQFHADVSTFVAGVDRVVVMMEKSYARNTKLLRSFQLGLVVLALIGTVLLIYIFSSLVVRPMQQLQIGIRRMAGEDFDVRLPVRSNDEFGLLAEGFNRMAGHLEDLYGTLESRVEAKTHSLEEKNNELAALYEIAAFLNEPASLEDLCHGYIQRVIRAVGAQGGAVRLFDGQSQKLFLLVHEGLSESFVEKESSLCLGECLCGEAIQSVQTIVFNVSKPPPNMTLFMCQREGFETVAAFNINFKKRSLGVFNLYFTGDRTIDASERHLLETLGQHLGGAVENQRLVSREKELAVTEERNLLAQELHDSIAQGLAFLNIKVQVLVEALKRKDIDGALEESGAIREGVQESYEDVRELLTHFRTRVREADLDAAISGSLFKFEGQTGIKTHFERLGTGAPLAAEYETQVLHIVQESLSNIRKHAHANTVQICIEHGLKAVVLTVVDDGVGFNQETDAFDQHVGLQIMKERAQRIGAAVDISSQPNQGTTVRLTLPRRHKEST